MLLKSGQNWYKLLRLATLKDLQGFLITAPAMLIMLLVGKLGVLGIAQSIGGIIAAVAMYSIGQNTSPKHRKYVFGAGLLLFAMAYFPIQFSVIDILTKREKRSGFAYI